MKKERRAAAAVCDMTMGAPLPLVLTFAVPLLISDVFQQVYSMVDTMVVGHVLGDAAISAIGATSALYALLISLASSMNTGFSIVITQAFGARDIETVKRGVAGAMLLNLAVAAVLTLAAVWLLRPLLRWMNTPQEIFRETYRYIVILCLGLAATVGYNLFAGLLRAVGNSRTPLYCLLLSSLVTRPALLSCHPVPWGQTLISSSASGIFGQEAAAQPRAFTKGQGWRVYFPLYFLNISRWLTG